VPTYLPTPSSGSFSRYASRAGARDASRGKQPRVAFHRRAAEQSEGENRKLREAIHGARHPVIQHIDDIFARKSCRASCFRETAGNTGYHCRNELHGRRRGEHPGDQHRGGESSDGVRAACSWWLHHRTVADSFKGLAGGKNGAADQVVLGHTTP
jgi:hypothetical protein